MKIIFKFILIFFFFFNFTAVQSNTKIAYIDIDFIMKQSKAGQSITVALENIHKKKIVEFNDLEIELKEKEQKILSKKNILNKEEFEKKIENLRKKVNSYRTNRKSTIDKLNQDRVNLTKKLLEKINPILSNYSAQNSLSIIIEKKNIVIGKSELDITNDILKILDEEVKEKKLN